ncbi:uncharacterized oxidoreductase YccK-like [Sycon ciliatum]|uniref:uncharacterized oxidoreductase YccK-like n=1 Tax=Sycon ciliatum TaxID=27933 RepID=UPI0031F6D3D6|eukprot:scpid72386/ scgid22455/ General stress protein 69; AKR11B
MATSTLPGTEVEISKVCLGCWQFGGTQDAPDATWGSMDQKAANDIVARAIDDGVTIFDTAEGYGNHQSEAVLAEALGSRRRSQGLQIASKFGRFSAQGPHKFTDVDIEQSLEASLRALKTDYIDLYQVHWPVNMLSAEITVKALERAKAQGKIRNYGVSNFGPQNLKDFVAAGGRPVTNQVPYNLLMRAVECDIIPACRENNVAILAYSPLQQGLLTGKFHKPEDVPEGRRRTRHFAGTSTSLSRHGQAGFEKLTFDSIAAVREYTAANLSCSMATASLSWIAGQSQVAACIVGARTPEQVSQNAKLATLTEEQLAKMSAMTDELKTAMGNNADMWAAESRMA